MSRPEATRLPATSFVDEAGRRTVAMVSGGRIRGEVLLLHFRWVSDRFDEREIQKLQRVFSTLAGLQGLGEPRPREWYPVGWLIRIDRSICELRPEVGDGTILEELGSFVGSQIASGSRSETPLTNRVHLATQDSLRTLSGLEDSSVIDYQPLTISSARVVRQSATFYHPAWCHMMRGFLTGILKSTSAIESRVIERECATESSSQCVFELRWL